MFQVHDYIVYGAAGVCQVDDIRENPFEGAPTGILYYVMHTLSEPRQVIFNPVSNDRVFTRYLMAREEATAFLSELQSVEALSAPSSKLLREEYSLAMKTYSPLGWGKVIRTFRKRLSEVSSRVTDAERAFYESAKRNLCTELALAFGEQPKAIETKILELLSPAEARSV